MHNRLRKRAYPQDTKIIVSVMQMEDEAVIIFKDNGIGTSNGLAKDIFKPFVRADAARNSQTGGTGLGLAIVEKIIVAHGGIIRLITDKNMRCEFIITLPIG